jgi:hypothetical protein
MVAFHTETTMRLLVMIMVGALSFADGAFAGSYASKAEMQSASTEWSKCIWEAVARLDDGISDAASIANGVVPECAASYQRLVTLALQGMTTPKAQTYFRDTYREMEPKLATSAVLKYRASRRSPAVQGK